MLSFRLIEPFSQKTKFLLAILVTGITLYCGACLYIASQQRSLIFNAKPGLNTTPDQPPINLDYESVRISVSPTRATIRGWWIPASSAPKTILPEEPQNIATSVNVILYLGGRGSNRSYHLPRVEGFHQLGFDVLMVDYRGYGDSDDERPSEHSVYQDSQAAWNYLTQVRRIPPQQILIYGESLGGAIALDLATRQSDAAGVILQSTFTSMKAIAERIAWFRFFPLALLLTERFDSLEKVKSLKIPVLFLHGTNDDVVPAKMSQELYDAAPSPKQLLLIPGGTHHQIFKPGKDSYLKAIEQFVLFGLKIRHRAPRQTYHRK